MFYNAAQIYHRNDAINVKQFIAIAMQYNIELRRIWFYGL